ncbi:prolipoprotein diacylglyceryl transferase family protein [Hymenobacter norwichensis]|uniref:prolipoprotein diacylglyceryl transferase family protein n=1 Tax=Hymenobacter norwichensis TaxID=223903 RepID=UPI0003B65D17|nr:prolipoprotein diacylglyceryl transferase family protein [Hymenobacter norwichensis]
MPLSATLLLPSPEGHAYSYYTTCYVAAFGVQLALLLRAGYKRGYPLQTWLVLVAASTLAFIVGTKLLALPADAWPALLQHGTWPATTARSVLGGGLGFGMVLLLLRRWLGFGWHVADAFAMPFCAGLVVQCVGCLLTGCCFGEVTDGSWGITYAAGSIPYIFQQQQGLLEMGAAHSLALHPTQLYTLVLCAGTGLVLWLTRHRHWPAGSWALLQAGLLVLGRLVIEFWREPAGEPVGAEFITLGGIRMMQLQWLLLPYATFLLAVWGLFVYHARTVKLTPEVPPRNQPVRNLLVVVLLLVCTLLLPAGALTLPEVVVMKAVLLVVVLLATATVLQGAIATRRAGLPLAAAAVVLLFTNQVPADSARTELEIGLGAGSGAFYEDVSTSGCSSPYSRETFDHRYSLRGGSIELHRYRPENRLTTYGLGIWQGQDRIAYQDLDPEDGTVIFQAASKKSLLDINPYIASHSRLRPGRVGFGFRVGLHLGRLARYGEKLDKWEDFSNANVELGTWVGLREIIYLQGDINRGMLGLGNFTSRVGLGSGLGRPDGSSILAGMAFSRHHPSYGMGFVEANIRLGNSGFMLYPYGATNFDGHHQVNMRVGYRIPLKKQ